MTQMSTRLDNCKGCCSIGAKWTKGPPSLALDARFEALMVKAQAGLAQLVEHLICNQGVTGSSPVTGTIKIKHFNKLCTCDAIGKLT